MGNAHDEYLGVGYFMELFISQGNLMEWIKVSDRLPEKDTKVLVAEWQNYGRYWAIEIVEYGPHTPQHSDFVFTYSDCCMEYEYHPQYWAELEDPKESDGL